MITATMVKDLREKTGAGMMDCKKVLTEADGDMEKAIELLDDDGICIMFLKTTFLETKARQKLFKKQKLRYIWQYVNRQIWQQNHNRIAYRAR